MSTVSDATRFEHHERMEELVNNLRIKCFEELDKALECGGIDPADYNSKEFVLAKIVLTIVGGNRHFAPTRDSKADKDLDNLRYFIG